MSVFIKENLNRILLLILAGLLLILWGRVVFRKINSNSAVNDLTTTYARVECAKSFGWEADPGSETKEKIKIPNEFDEIYIEYNKLQTMCGFDLRKYKGKTVVKYTYLVRNFPYETDEPVYINIYVYDDTMIAGDCMTRSLEGFMLPIDRRFMP